MKLPNLSARQKTVLKFIAVPVFYFFCLVIFVRLTFPYETLKNRILAEFNASESEHSLEIDEMSGSGFLGLEAEGVRLFEVRDKSKESEESAPHSLAVESASVSLGVFAYLFGNISVDFEAEVGGGELSGEFSQNSEEARIHVVGEKIDVSGLTLLSAGIGLPLGGELSGRVDLLLPEGLINRAEGTCEISISGLTAGDGKAKVRDTIALPKIEVGQLVLKAEAKEGRLEVSQLTAQGKDFEMSAEGKIRMRDPFDRSSLNLDVSFQFKESYTQKNDTTKAIFGTTGSKVPALFDLDPMVKRAKRPDGSYGWQVTGLLARPNFRPGKGKTLGADSEEEKE